MCIRDSPHEQAIASSLMGPEDVAVGIITFGRSRSILVSIRRAAARGSSIKMCIRDSYNGMDLANLNAYYGDDTLMLAVPELSGKVFTVDLGEGLALEQDR